MHEVNYLTKPIFEMHEFPEHLASLGHQVSFLHFPEGWDQSKIREQGYRSQLSGRVLSSSSVTLFTPKKFSGNLFGRLLTAIFAYQIGAQAIRDFKPDVVVSFSVPTSGWQMLLASRAAGIPFVFRALDVSHKIRKSPFQRLIKSAENFIYRKADWVSANNPAMLEYCLGMGASRERSSVELPVLDLAHFKDARATRDAMRSNLGIDNKSRVFLYMGSFFYFSGLPELIQGMLRTEFVSTKLVLVGGGEQERELRDLVAQLELTDRVLFTGFVSFADLPKYLGMADIALNSMEPSLVSHAAFPNKVLQYMASGLPVVSTRLRGLEKTFGKLPGLVFADDPRDVLDKAEKLSNLDNFNYLGDGNIDLVSSTFSAATAVKNFEKLLDMVVRQNG